MRPIPKLHSVQNLKIRKSERQRHKEREKREEDRDREKKEDRPRDRGIQSEEYIFLNRTHFTFSDTENADLPSEMFILRSELNHWQERTG